MDFNPNNKIVNLCLQGMAMEESGEREKALEIFKKAWNEASNDFEKFLSAHYIARQQKNGADRLQWLETTLQFALQIDDNLVKSAFPAIHREIGKCYKASGDDKKASGHFELAQSYNDNPTDNGPFYHGTRADLVTGDELIPGFQSNYKSDLKMNHIYFTAVINGAGLGAALANGNGEERVYIVEPTGPFENDPNVTDKKFPGNPTRSYRTQFPLKITGEIKDWVRTPPEEVQRWRDKLASIKGDIIN